MRTQRLLFASLLVVGCSSSSSDATPADGSTDSADTAVVDTGTPTDTTPDATPETSTDAKDTGPDGTPKSCKSASDCGDTTINVCDPATATCVPGECGGTGSTACPSGKICVYEAHGSFVGACYPTCKPFDAPCPDGAECIVGKFDGTDGYCKARGTTAADAACTRNDVTTSCVAGYLCDSLDLKCRKQCDFWLIKGASSVVCTGTQFCVPPGICTDDPYDKAAIGAPCAATAKNGDGCGVVGNTLTGVCTGTSAPYTCQKWCRSAGTDCPSGQTCKPTTIPSIGYCG